MVYHKSFQSSLEGASLALLVPHMPFSGVHVETIIAALARENFLPVNGTLHSFMICGTTHKTRTSWQTALTIAICATTDKTPVLQLSNHIHCNVLGLVAMSQVGLVGHCSLVDWTAFATVTHATIAA